MDKEFTPQIETALSVLEKERKRVAAEQEAFARFRNHVAEMETANAPEVQARTRQPVSTVMKPISSGQRLEDIQTAYRETVMNVPHYDEDYGESLAENIAEELGPEIASALTTADRFTPPPLRQTLLVASQRVEQARAAFLSALEAEATDLQHVADALVTIENNFAAVNSRALGMCSLEELAASREQVHSWRRQCDELAAERQTTLHGQRVINRGRFDIEFDEYVYDSLVVTHPGLADIAALGEKLTKACQRFDHALSSQ